MHKSDAEVGCKDTKYLSFTISWDKGELGVTNANATNANQPTDPRVPNHSCWFFLGTRKRLQTLARTPGASPPIRLSDALVIPKSYSNTISPMQKSDAKTLSTCHLLFLGTMESWTSLASRIVQLTYTSTDQLTHNSCE